MTKAGWFAILTGAALMLIALWTASIPLAALGITLLMCVAIAALLTLRMPALTATRRLEPAAITRGDSARGTVTVTSNSRWPTLPQAAIDSVGGRPVSFSLPRLAPNATSSTSYDLPTDHRGIVQVGPLRFVRSDPFGLIRRERALAGHAELFVRPRVHVMRLPRAGSERAVDGGESSRTLDGSVTFHTLREYVPGDDRRHVHWRTSARTGQLMVKQHVDLSRPQMLVVLDADSQSCLDLDAFEESVDIAVSLAAAAVNASNPVRVLVTSGGDITVNSHEELDRLLDLCAGVSLGPSSTELAGRKVLDSRGSLAVVVTTRYDEGLMQLVQAMRAGFASSAVAQLGPPQALGRTGEVLSLAAPNAVEMAALWNLAAAA